MRSELKELVSSDTIRFVARSLVRLGAPREDVDDLAQDVLLIAIRSSDRFDSDRALEPWLWGIARNRLRDHRKLAWNRRAGHEPDEERASGDDSARDELLAIALQKAMAALSEEEQILVVLHDLEGWTLAEAGAALGLSTDTAKYRIGVAKASLRKILSTGVAQRRAS